MKIAAFLRQRSQTVAIEGWANGYLELSKADWTHYKQYFNP